MNAERLVLYSLLLILQFIFCTSKDFINTNQFIKDGDVLISKGNHYALGFFSPGKSSNRYLGIWYYKLPEQTVVWVANRNSPIVGSSGVLSFDKYGNLVLYSDSNQNVSVWSANVSGEDADTSVAQLLDTGNFVLVQESGNIVWQSFHYPTHYVLPGMKLGLDLRTGLDRFLTSWRSADDPGVGDYSFKVNPSGSPQFFLYKGEKCVWRTSPWPWRPQRRLYSTQFVNDQDEIGMKSVIPPDDSVMVRLLVDHSGFVKAVKWHEIDGQWKEVWKAPRSQCDSYGWCGAYSTCEPTDFNKFECTCLPGYKPKNPSDWLLRNGSAGCVRKRLESSSVCGHGEGFVKVEIVFLPDTSAAVWVDMSMSQADCERECKRNCSCSAYASIDIPDKGTGCLAWYGELRDAVRFNMTDRYNLYVRVDALELAENSRKLNLGKEISAILIPTVASALLVISLGAYFWLKNRGNKGMWVANELRSSSGDQDLAFFKLSTISEATNNFSPDNKLGQGGFGSVYKGQLPDGEKIAVKRLSNNSRQGIEEFTNEVKVIAKLQHRNLVKLLGCCIQGGEQMVIYEYLPNKSLDSFLFDETGKLFLDWPKRFEIIVGIARGILYLHQDSRLRIIHRDLKCSNILLDADMNPKISDFGMARIFKSDQILDKTNRVVGTFGYMSPEYAVFGKFSLKSDVFSFGVMLLEIVSGEKNNKFNPQNPSRTLIGHVWGLWKEDRALEIVDSSLQELYPPQQALKCIQIGLLCVQENAMDRPSMLAVDFMLNSNETTIPSPKQPAFVCREPCTSPQVAGSGCLNVTMTDIEGR